VAELSLQERLQPSLLDRLTDNEPDSKVESRAQRVLSLNRLRRSVLRDLAWLLNCGNLAVTEDLSDFPEVTNSVINYGVAGLAGTSAKSTDIPRVEREVRQAILDFEPRILAKSLSVKVVLDDEKLTQKMLTFQIEGQLWAQPLPVNLYLSTDVDLETGTTMINETSG
jgi:type VI secretion system protein ImpF